MTKDDEPYALSPDEVARRLSIDTRTFYRNIYPAIRAGQIESLKIGRARRIVWKSLLEWLERETREKDNLL